MEIKNFLFYVTLAFALIALGLLAAWPWFALLAL